MALRDANIQINYGELEGNRILGCIKVNFLMSRTYYGIREGFQDYSAPRFTNGRRVI